MMPLYLAASSGNLNLVKYLIETKGADFTLQSNYGRTPVHLAASYGNLNLVKYLIDNKGADFILKDNYGWNPLHWDASSGSLDIVKHLINTKDANINAVDNTVDGRKSIHVASKEVVKILFSFYSAMALMLMILLLKTVGHHTLHYAPWKGP